MSERRVVYLHGLRNALIPLITLVGLELPASSVGARGRGRLRLARIGRLALSERCSTTTPR